MKGNMLDKKITTLVFMLGAFSSVAEAKSVSVKLMNASLTSAVKAISDETGLQFIVVPSEEPFNKINLNVQNIEANDAVRYICSSAGGWAELDANGVYIIRKGNAPVVDLDKTFSITCKIKCNNLDVKEVYEMLTSSKLDEKNHKTDSGKDFISSKHTSVVENKDSEDGVQSMIDIKPTASHQFPNIDGDSSHSLPTPMPGSSPYSTGSTLPGNSKQPNPMPYNRPSPYVLPGRGLPNNNNPAPGRGLVPEGIEYLSYSPVDNNLIVKGTSEAVEKLEKTVKMIDVAPEQVVVKVEFIETTIGDSLETGVDWKILGSKDDKDYSLGVNENVTKNSVPAIKGGDSGKGDKALQSFVPMVPFFFKFAQGNNVMQLRAQLNDSNSKTVDSPMLRTLNNQPAKIELVDKHAYLLKKDASSGNSSRIEVEQEIYEKESKRSLHINPRINGDGTITIHLKPIISKFIPVKNEDIKYKQQEQQLDIVTKVKNGETIVLGGMKNKYRETSHSKVPILGDIPLLGRLFSKSTSNDTERDLLIFITVDIVTDND